MKTIEKFKILKKEAIAIIKEKVSKKGTKSRFPDVKAKTIEIEKGELRFDLPEGSILTEISKTRFMDWHGYSRPIQELPLDQLCMLADKL